MRHPLLALILSSLAACAAEREEGEACMLVELGDTCPAPEDVALDEIANPWDCDNEVVEMLSDETPEPRDQVFQTGDAGCCYDVVMVDRTPRSECIVGRPFLHDGAPVRADADAPAGPAAGWAEVARAEHASVAAFAKLTLQLMAHGAPPALLARVTAAASDEVRHAEGALRTASRLAGAPVRLGPTPFPAPVDPRGSLVALAVDAVREGCVGETLSALATRRAAERARDPEVSALLFAIADDEDRHAALSWAVVDWAMRQGGPEVRAAVAAAFREPVRWGGQVPTEDLADLGLLGPEEMRRVAEAGLREVVGPAAGALLAA